MSVEDADSASLIIDSPTTQDRDDALWVARVGEGWHVRVSIAHARDAITVGSMHDQRARRQGATHYLPEGGSRPMLPG